jgi:hypothetical protein
LARSTEVAIVATGFFSLHKKGNSFVRQQRRRWTGFCILLGENSFGGLAPPPTCFAMSVIRQFSLACTNPINEVWCDSDESYLLPFMPAKVDASGLVRKCVPNFLTGQA